MLRIWAFLAILYSCPAFPAGSARICPEALSPMAIIGQHEVSAVFRNSVHTPVYRLTFGNGQVRMVRHSVPFSRAASDAAFEVFAARVASWLGVLTSAPELLPDEHRQTLIATIRDRGSDATRIVPYLKDASITAGFAWFVEGQLGRNIIDAAVRRVGNPMAAAEIQSLQTKLAFAWATVAILGIPDLHDTNWMLTQDGDVALFDLAYRSVIFSEGRALLRSADGLETQTPLGRGYLVKSHYEWLLSGLEEADAARLAALDGPILRELASATGFALTKAQVWGVLARRDRILSERARVVRRLLPQKRCKY